MRIEALTIPRIELNVPSLVVSDLTPLEVETLNTTNFILGVTERWMEQGDQMFASSSSKVSMYRDIRSMSSHIPRYTNAVDVRDKNAIPNRQSVGLDTAFAKLHVAWSDEPDIKKLLEDEKIQFEVRYKKWFGTVDEGGERARFINRLMHEQEQLGCELSEQEIEGREMKARHAYFLPTITTASAPEPV